jgi:hypothetical protein
MKLRLADPARIDLYATQIAEIGASVKDSDLFNRVKKACLDQQAFLFYSSECFVVLKPIEDSVLAWVGAALGAVNRDCFMDDLDQLCKDIAATRVFFYSNRSGFSRVAKKFGFSSSPSIWMGEPVLMWERHYVQ